MTNHILIRSRDADFFMLMGHILANAGYGISHLEDAGGVHLTGSRKPAAIIVDTSGEPAEVIAFCSAVKHNPVTFDVPLLALVRARDEDLYLEFIKAGVDEGFIRPVSPDRILSALKSYIGPDCETATGTRPPQDGLRFGDFDIDEETRMLQGPDGNTQLSPIEFRLLKRLLQAPGRVLSREDLIESAWPPNHFVQPRTVDVHIGNLRRTLERETGRRIIRTIRSNGYAADVSDCNE